MERVKPSVVEVILSECAALASESGKERFAIVHELAEIRAVVGDVLTNKVGIAQLRARQRSA